MERQINGRLEWAWKHVAKARVLIETWGRDHPYRVVPERDPATGYFSFRLREVKPIPPDLGFVVADAVHNLRSALDNTVWALRDTTASDGVLRQISFFRARDAHAWRSWAGSVKTALAQDVLADLQDLGFNRARDAFGGLDALWQASKHRIPTFGLSLSATSATVIIHHGNMDITGGSGPFDEGDTIAEGRPHPGTEPEVEPHWTLEIAFEREGPCSGVPVYGALVDLHHQVRDAILPRFLARL
jgi:hypothetical protein